MENTNAKMSANWSRVALPQSSQEAGRIADFWVELLRFKWLLLPGSNQIDR